MLVWLGLGLCLISPFALAADSIELVQKETIVYLEAGGTAIYGSANIERAIGSLGIADIYVRIGLSTYGLKNFGGQWDPSMLLPLGVPSLIGKSPHFLETAPGFMFTSLVGASNDTRKPERKWGIHGMGSIGYRYQKPAKGLFFKLVYTPILEHFRQWHHWAGLGIGYSL